MHFPLKLDWAKIGFFFSFSGGHIFATSVLQNSRRWLRGALPFFDDAALAIETQKGLVILLGCAHSGLINTVEHFRRELGDPRIHAIIGGTHLGPASDEQFAATVDYLKRLDFDRLGVSHCTGQVRSAQLYVHFPNKVFFANVGSTLRV